MNLTKKMPTVVSLFDFIKPGEDMLRISRSWDSCCGRWWSGQPDGLSPEGYSKSDYGRSWSSQEWKSEATAHDRSGKLDEISWNAMLDGNGQSAKYGEMIYDGSRQPDSANYQEEANSETFVMGGDAAEVVNKVKRPSAKQTEKNVERCRFLWRTFNNLVNVYGCDEECGDIHGKKFSQLFKIFIMNSEDLTLKQMFDITAHLVGEQEEINNLDKISWKNHSWKQLSFIGDETVINLYRTTVYLRIFRFSVVPWKGPSTSGIQRSLEKREWMNHQWKKLQRFWRNQKRADWIRVEHFPRIHNDAALR